MRNYYLLTFLAILACLLSEACTKEDDTDFVPVFSEGDFQLERFHFRTVGNDSIVADSVLAMPDRDFREQIVNRGWRFVVSYPIDSNGINVNKPQTLEEGQSLIPDYCFTNECLLEFACLDGSKSPLFLNHVPYSYNEEHGTITMTTMETVKINEGTNYTLGSLEELTMLSYNSISGVIAMLHRQTQIYGSKGEKETLYELVFYQRMKDSYLNRILQQYFNGPYIFEEREDGMLSNKGKILITEDTFERYIVGHGWKLVRAHRFRSPFNGNMEKENFANITLGWNHYEYFLNEDNATLFFLSDKVINSSFLCYQTIPYEYSGNSLILKRIDDNLRFSILSYDNDSNNIVVLDDCQTSPYHLLLVYHQMTDEELENYRKIYITDYSQRY